MNIIQNLKDVNKIKLILLLIICVIMFFPITGNWMQYGEDESYEYPIYYTLWDLKYVISVNPEKTQSWPYDNLNSPPKPLPVIITCVISGYIMFVMSVFFLILYPSSSMFTVPLIIGGLLAMSSYFLWIQTIPRIGKYTSSLETQLIGALLIIIFGVICNFI